MSIEKVANDSRLTFIKVASRGCYRKGEKERKAIGLYLCRCGNTVEVMIERARRGSTRSCGCLQRETAAKNATHGLRRHPLYAIWMSMNQRCKNPRNPAYMDYGGRGVVVCKEWATDFQCFYGWAIKNEWKPGMQIDKDKISNAYPSRGLVYSPETCSILTRKENANQKRNNRKIEFNGEIKNLCQWADDLGVSHGVLQQRIRRGGQMRDVIAPQKKFHNHTRINGEIVKATLSLNKEGKTNIYIADKFNIDRATVSRIIHKKGISPCHYI